VAGKRAGLDGERSGLFLEAIRIIKEMRDATDGQFPRFAVWENVPGAFSSNGGQDFRAVLEEIAEAEIPMPTSGKWAEAGMVRTERIDIAWRTLDAQHWGVPQRRRRIFLVADFGGQCASEVLFEREGLSGNITEGRKEGQAVTGSAGDSVKTASYGFISGQSAQAGSLGFAEEVSPVLKADAGGNTVPAVLTPQLYDMTHADEVIRPVEPGLCPALNARMGTGGNQVPVMMTPTCFAIDRASFNQGKNAQYDFQINDDDIAQTIVSKGPGAVAQKPYYAVRRLTPTECLRLQGYPDWWLDIEGMSDSAKYRAIGNSVAIPCVDYVLGGIAEVLKGGGPHMQIGDKVLVPRTGGGASLGKIVELYTDRARVSFRVGETYRGRHVTKLMRDAIVFKTVKLSELQAIEEAD
jgi:DNA (cytosine-5)-methyltransferase 1